METGINLTKSIESTLINEIHANTLQEMLENDTPSIDVIMPSDLSPTPPPMPIKRTFTVAVKQPRNFAKKIAKKCTKKKKVANATVQLPLKKTKADLKKTKTDKKKNDNIENYLKKIENNKDTQRDCYDNGVDDMSTLVYQPSTTTVVNQQQLMQQQQQCNDDDTEINYDAGNIAIVNVNNETIEKKMKGTTNASTAPPSVTNSSIRSEQPTMVSNKRQKHIMCLRYEHQSNNSTFDLNIYTSKVKNTRTNILCIFHKTIIADVTPDNKALSIKYSKTLPSISTSSNLVNILKKLTQYEHNTELSLPPFLMKLIQDNKLLIINNKNFNLVKPFISVAERKVISYSITGQNETIVQMIDINKNIYLETNVAIDDKPMLKFVTNLDLFEHLKDKLDIVSIAFNIIRIMRSNEKRENREKNKKKIDIASSSILEGVYTINHIIYLTFYLIEAVTTDIFAHDSTILDIVNFNNVLILAKKIYCIMFELFKTFKQSDANNNTNKELFNDLYDCITYMQLSLMKESQLMIDLSKCTGRFDFNSNRRHLYFIHAFKYIVPKIYAYMMGTKKQLHSMIDKYHDKLFSLYQKFCAAMNIESSMCIKTIRECYNHVNNIFLLNNTVRYPNIIVDYQNTFECLKSAQSMKITYEALKLFNVKNDNLNKAIIDEKSVHLTLYLNTLINQYILSPLILIFQQKLDNFINDSRYQISHTDIKQMEDLLTHNRVIENNINVNKIIYDNLNIHNILSYVFIELYRIFHKSLKNRIAFTSLALNSLDRIIRYIILDIYYRYVVTIFIKFVENADTKYFLNILAAKEDKLYKKIDNTLKTAINDIHNEVITNISEIEIIIASRLAEEPYFHYDKFKKILINKSPFNNKYVERFFNVLEQNRNIITNSYYKTLCGHNDKKFINYFNRIKQKKLYNDDDYDQYHGDDDDNNNSDNITDFSLKNIPMTYDSIDDSDNEENYEDYGVSTHATNNKKILNHSNMHSSSSDISSSGSCCSSRSNSSCSNSNSGGSDSGSSYSGSCIEEEKNNYNNNDNEQIINSENFSIVEPIERTERIIALDEVTSDSFSDIRSERIRKYFNIEEKLLDDDYNNDPGISAYAEDDFDESSSLYTSGDECYEGSDYGKDIEADFDEFENGVNFAVNNINFEEIKLMLLSRLMKDHMKCIESRISKRAYISKLNKNLNYQDINAKRLRKNPRKPNIQSSSSFSPPFKKQKIVDESSDEDENVIVEQKNRKKNKINNIFKPLDWSIDQTFTIDKNSQFTITRDEFKLIDKYNTMKNRPEFYFRNTNIMIKNVSNNNFVTCEFLDQKRLSSTKCTGCCVNSTTTRIRVGCWYAIRMCSVCQLIINKAVCANPEYYNTLVTNIVNKQIPCIIMNNKLVMNQIKRSSNDINHVTNSRCKMPDECNCWPSTYMQFGKKLFEWQYEEIQFDNENEKLVWDKLSADIKINANLYAKLSEFEKKRFTDINPDKNKYVKCCFRQKMAEKSIMT